jgi:hypothetical protein
MIKLAGNSAFRTVGFAQDNSTGSGHNMYLQGNPATPKRLEHIALRPQFHWQSTAFSHSQWLTFFKVSFP